MKTRVIRFGLLSSLMLCGALFVGCSGDCTSAADCAADEVCYKEVCTAAQAEYLTCGGDEECNEPGSNLFVCIGGACRLASTGGTNTADASVTDTGAVDSGTNTSTVPDAGN